MIGIFDSGYGGLSIFKSIEKKLPQYDYIYLGDNARAPYGDKSQRAILNYSKQAVDYLFKRGCNLVIFACNTASAMALRKIQQEYLPGKYRGKNVLGVVRPLAEAVGEISKNKIVAVMGTASTVKSEAYVHELADVDRNIKVIQQDCPLLVPMIERSEENQPAAQMAVTEYVRPLKKENPDVVILGCTHYGFLADMIKKNFGGEVKVLDSGKIVADKLAEYLERHPEYNQTSDEQKRIFLTTNSTEAFDRAAEKFLGRKIKSKSIKLK